MGRELRNHVIFGDGMPKAMHCSKTVVSTSRITSDGGKLTSDGLTVNIKTRWTVTSDGR